jgi:hypothetical protein
MVASTDMPRITTKRIAGGLVVWAILAQGCIIVPIPTSDQRYSGTLVPARLIDTVNDPGASRADVLLALGPPNIILGDEEAYIYTGEISDLFVVGAVGIGAPGGGVGVAGSGGASSDPTVREWVVFLFGVNGSVGEVGIVQDSVWWKRSNTEQLDAWFAAHAPHLLEQLHERLSLHWIYLGDQNASEQEQPAKPQAGYFTS